MTSLQEPCPFDPPAVNAVIFASDGRFSAIYNRSPIVPGHFLVIPNRHIESLYEMSEVDCVRLISFARDTTRFILDVFDADSFDWTLQEGEPAGQTVPHLHLHVIPRYAGDLPSPGDWYPRLEAARKSKLSAGYVDSDSRPPLNDDELRIIVEKLRRDYKKSRVYKKK